MSLPPWKQSVSWFWAAATVTLAACGSSDRSTTHARPTSSRPADSLAVAGHGVEVWFTLARSAKASDGGSCVERGLEIRRATKRIQVPLLYTGEKPMLLNDSIMQARLWTGCRVVAPYLVDLRTGRPVRDTAGK